jgi:hypothetical protein
MGVQMGPFSWTLRAAGWRTLQRSALTWEDERISTSRARPPHHRRAPVLTACGVDGVILPFASDWYLGHDWRRKVIQHWGLWKGLTQLNCLQNSAYFPVHLKCRKGISQGLCANGNAEALLSPFRYPCPSWPKHGAPRSSPQLPCNARLPRKECDNPCRGCS